MKTANKMDKVADKTPIIPITERIKTLEDVYKDLGLTAESAVPYPNSEDADEKWINACQNIKLIAKCLNEGTELELGVDTGYYPYFDVRNNGFVLYYYGCYNYYYSSVPTRLLFETSQKALYAGKTFLSVYKDYITLR